MKEYNDYLDHLLAYQQVKDAYIEKQMREEEQAQMALEHGGRRSSSAGRGKP